MNKIKVSVGIPAYNEEANIRHLLSSLISQIEDGFELLEIIVVSDASSDATIEIVKSFNNSKIKLVEHKVRVGQQTTQNEIMHLYKGDLLVITEADILPENNHFLKELITPFIATEPEEKLAMVIGHSVSVKSRNFFENVLKHNHDFKEHVFESWKEINIYMCGGHAMKVLPRWVTQEFKWPKNVPEDSYIYLWIVKNGYKIISQPNAKVLMKNVESFGDRLKQCKKYHSGKNSLKKYFNESLIDSEYDIPKSILLKYVFLDFLQNPFWMILVVSEMLINRVFTSMSKNFNSLYLPYVSSKKLI